MASDKFCLKWNDFESNISVAFQDLRGDKDFFDVTLACDGDQIQAHKVILAACSPFFRNILRRNPHQHPLLYLKGVKFPELQSVLNFMYHGEVNVAQEDLNSFLVVAEELRIKGLTQGGQKEDSSGLNQLKQGSNQTQKSLLARPVPIDRESPVSAPKKFKTLLPPPQPVDDDEIQEVQPVPAASVKTEAPEPQHTIQPVNYYQDNNHEPAEPGNQIETYQGEDYRTEDNYEDYSGQYSMDSSFNTSNITQMENTGKEGPSDTMFSDPTDLLQFVTRTLEGKYTCSICQKFCHAGKAHVRNHVESKHFPNHFIYNCDQCDKTFTTKNGVANHRSVSHKQFVQ